MSETFDLVVHGGRLVSSSGEHEGVLAVMDGRVWAIVPRDTRPSAERLNQYLKPISGALHYHIGKMARSHRPVVDQTYQVALNLVFPDKKTQDEYQVDPLHVEFVEKVFKRVCQRVVVYDVE